MFLTMFLLCSYIDMHQSQYLYKDQSQYLYKDYISTKFIIVLFLTYISIAKSQLLNNCIVEILKYMARPKNFGHQPLNLPINSDKLMIPVGLLTLLKFNNTSSKILIRYYNCIQFRYYNCIQYYLILFINIIT